MVARLTIAALVAVGYFIFWFLSMIWHRRRKENYACPANSHWDDAPVFPGCQRKCKAGEISDGRGECVSAAIPFTKMTLDSLGQGKL